MSEEYEGNFLFEYSPESFTGTEPEYAVEVCNAVLDGSVLIMFGSLARVSSLLLICWVE